MRGDSGQLPVDFLIGFTIFILCLIMTANFVPSLLVGLQRTSGIDYDAVAYRTGVVLTEDPGWPAGNPSMGDVMGTDSPPWELQDNTSVVRMGLGLSPDSPNILSINKITRFFDGSIFSDGDYRSKLLFSQYGYGYNISLRSTSPLKSPGDPILNLSIGDPHPAGYGYIRRYVLIKQNSNVTLDINATYPYSLFEPPFDAQDSGQVTQELRIRLDGRLLYNNNSIPNPYKIDLIKEPFTIRITNLRGVLNNSALNPTSPMAHEPANWTGHYPACPVYDVPPTGANLYAVRTYFDCPGGAASFDTVGYGMDQQYVLSVDDDPLKEQTVPPGIVTPVFVQDNLTLTVGPLWPSGSRLFSNSQCIEIGFIFRGDKCVTDPVPPRTLITGTLIYDDFNATRWNLVPGMLEVSIW